MPKKCLHSAGYMGAKNVFLYKMFLCTRGEAGKSNPLLKISTNSGPVPMMQNNNYIIYYKVEKS
jgi:hypothetical protein